MIYIFPSLCSTITPSISNHIIFRLVYFVAIKLFIYQDQNNTFICYLSHIIIFLSDLSPLYFLLSIILFIFILTITIHYCFVIYFRSLIRYIIIFILKVASMIGLTKIIRFNCLNAYRYIPQ